MSTFKLIEIAETKQRLQSEEAILVDTRDAQSFAADHAEGAFHLTNETLKEFVDKVEFDTPVFVVCYHGNSSKGVAQYLAEQGYEDVYSVEGGMSMWRQMYPLTASES
ncbi:thiosulfate sulfurtransferase GlpE [Psychromonas sp.]|nr:thiosulfate sulfurtransferase GlpE [Psychromonas sp.]